jgi:hypothetical protein
MPYFYASAIAFLCAGAIVGMGIISASAVGDWVRTFLLMLPSLALGIINMQLGIVRVRLLAKIDEAIRTDERASARAREYDLGGPSEHFKEKHP